MARRMQQQPQGRHASREKPVSRANRAPIVVSALSAAHVANVVIAQSAHRVMRMQFQRL
jgi:hypothetical protein